MIVRRNDGEEVGAFGHYGKQAGQFHNIHQIVSDSKGNIYTGEVDTGMRSPEIHAECCTCEVSADAALASLRHCVSPAGIHTTRNRGESVGWLYTSMRCESFSTAKLCNPTDKVVGTTHAYYNKVNFGQCRFSRAGVVNGA